MGTTTATTTKRQSVSGGRITTFHSVAFAGTYAAGGDSFDANAVSGLSNVDDVNIVSGQLDGFTVLYDYANKKLRILAPSTEASGDEVQVVAAVAQPMVEFANGGDATGMTALIVHITGTR